MRKRTLTFLRTYLFWFKYISFCTLKDINIILVSQKWKSIFYFAVFIQPLSVVLFRVWMSWSLSVLLFHLFHLVNFTLYKRKILMRYKKYEIIIDAIKHKRIIWLIILMIPRHVIVSRLPVGQVMNVAFCPSTGMHCILMINYQL